MKAKLETVDGVSRMEHDCPDLETLLCLLGAGVVGVLEEMEKSSFNDKERIAELFCKTIMMRIKE